MTIRSRNRLIKILFWTSNLFFAFTLGILIFQIINKSLNFDYFNQYIKPDFILVKYNPYCVLISLFFPNIYVSFVNYILYRSFEKTPATEAIYVCLYLIACLANCCRILIGLLNLGGTSSNFLIACGNIILFSEILYPLALLFIAMMPIVEQKQDSDRNMFFTLVLCIFFAEMVPLNTTHTTPNFGVAIGYKTLINIVIIICTISGIIIIFFRNKKRVLNQKTTLGYTLTVIGITIILNTVNILELATGMICLGAGAFFYFYELHKQYLWND